MTDPRSKSNPHHLRRTREHCPAHRGNQHGNQGARRQSNNGGNMEVGEE